MSQAELAAEAGIAKKSQTNYELGHNAPAADYLAAIAMAGVDVLYVLTGVPAPIANAGEAELLRRYRAASPEIRAAVFAALGAVLTPSAGHQPAVAISGGEQGQVVAGDSKQERLTINVGGKKRGARK